MRYRLALVLGFAISCAREGTSSLPRSRSSEAALPTNPAALAQLLGVPPDSLRAAGEERYQRQAYDSAQAIFRVELTRARQRSDSAGEARVHMWLGLAAWHLGNYATAHQEDAIAIQMKRALHLDDEMSRSFNALGLLAWNEGRELEALSSFDSAVVWARRRHDAEGVARASANIPLVQVELGNYDDARRALDLALNAARAVHDERVEGNDLTNLAMLEIRLGQPSAALPLLFTARQRYAHNGFATGESNALGQLATAWAALGYLQRAIATADSALAIARSLGFQQEVAGLLEVIADFQAEAGSPREALQRLLEADSLDVAMGLRSEHGSNLRRISSILSSLGEDAPAVRRSRDALAVHLALSEQAEVVSDRLQLTRALAAFADTGAARAEVDSATHEAQRTGSESLVRDATLASARLAIDAHDPARALRLIGGAEVENDWEWLDLEAEALLATGHPMDARRAEKRALSILGRERSSLAPGALRSGYLTNKVSPFARLVAIDLVLGDTVDAYRTAAAVPGSGIAERLGESMTEAPPELASFAEAERELSRVTALEQQLDSLRENSQKTEQRAALTKELARARQRYATAVAKRDRSPKAALLDLPAVTPNELEHRLAANDALVTYLSAPDRLYIFTVRRSGIGARVVPVDARALSDRVRTARQLLAGGSSNPSTLTALGELYDLLMAPEIAGPTHEAVEQLIVVPHASLDGVPFAALWNRRTGRYLIEDHVVSYSPSAALMTGRAQRFSPIRDLVAFAPLPDSLPGTEREVRAIHDLVPGSQLAIGRAATEQRVRAALASAHPIHIASHGAHNDQNPLFSRMTVGQAVDSTAPNDGQLEVREVLGLHTESPLVFLSGCETGVTTTAAPFTEDLEEGSLAHAFLVAGAANVIATLWRVDDDDAAQVVRLTYQRLARGEAPAAALAGAQRVALHRNQRWTWAAYAVWSTERANVAVASVSPRKKQ